jgi:CheY-like chemotaxis protein
MKITPVRILIIEDHVDNLELMTYLLTAFGYETITADNGLAGMERVEHDRPDLIICDIQIPGIDGYEVARRVKRSGELRAIPLVAITALAMVGDRDRVMSAGFDGYIPKPITPDTFLGEIEAFLPPERRLSGLARVVTPPVPLGQAVARDWIAAAPTHRGIILAVDNNRANLELARSLFEPSGYIVVTANNGMEALATAKKVRPDLILSDVSMPEFGGYELVLAVRADPDLKASPVILISSSRTGNGEEAVAVGATKFLKRPLDPDILLSEVQRCLLETKAGNSGAL